MRIAGLAATGLMLVMGCAPSGGIHAAGPLSKPIRRGHGLVTGRTMHITSGIPGALAGKPGKTIPPQPVPKVDVYFRGESGTFKVTSGSDGTYSVELLPGKYRIGWLGPLGGVLSKSPFEESQGFSAEITEVSVEVGKIHKRDLPVSTMFVD